MLRITAAMYGFVALLVVAVNLVGHVRHGLPKDGWAAYEFPALLAGVLSVISMALWWRLPGARWAALTASTLLSLFCAYQVYVLILQLPPILDQHPEASVWQMLLAVSAGCLFSWVTLALLLRSFRRVSATPHEK